MAKYWTWGLSVLVGIGVFLFWYKWYPHALNYQEQYQLFLWTWDYLLKALSVPGGLADWMGEFIVQFYYVKWVGALLLALVFVVFGCLAGWVPAALLLWLMGDPSALLGYAMAVIIAVGAYRVNTTRCRVGLLCDVVAVPLVYWAAGTLAWVYVVLRIVVNRKWAWPLPLYMLTLQLLAYRLFLTQWTLEMVFKPMQYYRIPMQMPDLMWIIPVVIVFLIGIQTWLQQKPRTAKPGGMPAMAAVGLGELAVAVVLAWTGISKGYDRDLYELIWQDWQVRQEHWDEIVQRARQYQVRTAFSSVCVNLALAEKRQLADRMFDFWQSGDDALIMPRIKDLTSMLPSAEAFWRLGMVNSALRYMFDTQESILNGRKSGRCTKRIAECMLVNGNYKTARKFLNLLDHSLFYREWAHETEELIGQEDAIKAHPVYGRLRQLRYKDDFLYSHYELYKMLGLLFMNNHENRMALDYFMGQMLLTGELQGFQQYMGLVQQYGGYREMPIGYQDAMICIQKQGAVPGSPYATYVKRVMMERRNHEDNEVAH